MVEDIPPSFVVSFCSFWFFLLHWAYELPCQGKLPEFHNIPIVGCIRVFWLVLHPLGLELDKALFGSNSVTHLVMGSLLGPMTLMRDMPLILIFDEFGDYTQKGNSNSQHSG